MGRKLKPYFSFQNHHANLFSFYLYARWKEVNPDCHSLELLVNELFINCFYWLDKVNYTYVNLICFSFDSFSDFDESRTEFVEFNVRDQALHPLGVRKVFLPVLVLLKEITKLQNYIAFAMLTLSLVLLNKFKETKIQITIIWLSDCNFYN